MCGIAGFVESARISDCEKLSESVRLMTSALNHRGPDSSGIWVDQNAGVAFGHARLAILDLSESGHQPMASSCGRYVITFNGEIYNFVGIREELKASGRAFRGHSDTEVLVEAISEWGVSKTLERIKGMFAFAVCIHDENKVVLVRDRIGKKPLYYGWLGDTFYFGSELSALRAHPSFKAEINRDSVSLFFRYSCVPSPYSILKGICKVDAGEMVETNIRTRELKRTDYWSLRSPAERGVRAQLNGEVEEIEELLDAQLRAAVKRRMVADVPVGAFLSGGTDSTLVVSLMQALSSEPVRSFTIGFEETAFDEAPFARAVAKHLNTHHTEIRVTSREAQEVIPLLPKIYDEPFGDVSQIPTSIVCQLARQHVTVALSGDGGDEFFCGYDRYFSAKEKWNRYSWLPTLVRKSIAASGMRLARFQPANAALWRQLRQLEVADPVDWFALRSERIDNAQLLVPGAGDLPTVYTDPLRRADISDPLQQMMYLDARAWLPDDILVKVDRASMAVGLEVRNPLLDSDFLALAWRVPIGMKVRGGERKWILKKLLSRYVPEDLSNRPKKGFAVPIVSWLQGPLREWAEEMLDEGKIKNQGILDYRIVKWYWKQLLGGAKRYRMTVWNLIMFQAWINEWET